MKIWTQNLPKLIAIGQVLGFDRAELHICEGGHYETITPHISPDCRKPISQGSRYTEWWTITDEARFYEYRHTIPFRTLYCHTDKGGLVVYLDHPEVTP